MSSQLNPSFSRRTAGVVSIIVLGVAISMLGASMLARANDNGGGDPPKGSSVSGTKGESTEAPSVPPNGIGSAEAARVELDHRMPGASALIDEIESGHSATILDVATWTDATCLDYRPRGGLQPVCELLGLPSGSVVRTLDISSPEIQMSSDERTVGRMLTALLETNRSSLVFAAFHGESAILGFDLADARILPADAYLGSAPVEWLVVEVRLESGAAAVARLLPLNAQPTPIDIWRSEMEYDQLPHGPGDILFADGRLQ